ncbi:MAG TPA: site-specific integrase [Candidatus Dormibacteraeota bacterium]|nr:site-specific integrase [Candidatus Dormibacteraeota bacterium]
MSETEPKDRKPRRREQRGQIIRIGDNWFVRYWERRNVGGVIERKRVSHRLGPVTTRGKRAPADIETEAEKHMATVTTSAIRPEHVVTVGDFVDGVYLPWVMKHKRPSTYKQYRDVWEDHLRARCGKFLLKQTRTFHVQQWLDDISAVSHLSRNSLRRIKSTISGMFSHAKRQAYFESENPTRDTAIDPHSAEPQETYAYSLEEIQSILAAIPEPAATAFAFAAFMGLRCGEIEGLLWENYAKEEMSITRSVWHGHVNAPKTRKSSQAVPVIRQLTDRLEIHRLRCGNPQSGPIFANGLGKPLSMNNLLKRVILPALNRCAVCRKAEIDHDGADHPYNRDERIPSWHGWHAGRRGLGSNLYRLGVPEMVVQRILRHSNVSTTQTYYIKTIPADVRTAMEKFADSIPAQASQDTYGTLKEDGLTQLHIVN